MTAAAADLYRTIVLEHGKHPRNVGRLQAPTHAADGDNPLCGDAVRIEVARAGDVLMALRFAGESCVLATASASLMTECLSGATIPDARRLIERMEAFCTRGGLDVAAHEEELGALRAFRDVHRHPVRVGCALLPWRTLRSALGD